MPAFKLIEKGKRFGRLVVIGGAVRDCGVTRYPCKCDCGQQTLSRAAQLINGTSASCGCARKQTLSKLKTTHGKSKSRLYILWWGIKARCYNPNHISYRYYGAKGVRVGSDFLDFPNFEKWAITAGYHAGLTIERKDSNKNYTADNCVWADRKTQNRNSGSTHKVDFQGKSLCLEEWSEITGIKAHTIRGRLKRGWPIWKTLTTKAREICKRQL